ncbi:IS1634 family transposase [Hydrogenimonas thermophila]|nr:IS1634 family transposase [Hydrogenimonas thermophila]WOE69924.1 IS1634 family transposase [Hydrogenimonas thermophila]
MFVRKKKNPSGSISVQIIKKVNGKSKVIKTLGCSKDEEEINRLVELGKKQIKELEPSLFEISETEQIKREFISFRNDQIIPIGDELFIGKIYDRLGLADIFKDIKSIRYKEEKEFLFRSLVLSRILYPGSKLYLIDYLWYFKQKEIDIEKVYRFLDTLYKDEIKIRVEKSIFNYTLSKINNNLVVSFYDVTTLHFESESEDDLKRVGFSKEGKLNRPQIQLGLLTTLEGFPLAYEVYEGNRFEGHTLIETLKKFEKRFNLKQKPIIVADRGMLSNCNIIELEKAGYRYIIAARIKSLKDCLKEKIANLVFLSDIDTKEFLLDEELICKEKSKIKDKAAIKQRLILSYSTQRSKK